MPRRAAVQLAPGVFRIPTAPASAINSFVFRDDDGHITVVDCGLERGARWIANALVQLSSDPSEITQIIVTHAHLDHAGGLARLSARTGAPVAAHERDAPYLRAGRVPGRDGSSLAGRVFGLLPRGFAPTEVAREFVDGDVLPVAGGLRVVHTPGHTPGHVSLLHEGTGVLIVGDALMNLRALRWTPASLCTDSRLTRQTAAVLADLNFEVAAFSHGPEIRGRAREVVRSFLRGHEVAP